MQTHFELELEKLKKRIVKMGNLAIQQTFIATQILIHGDTLQKEVATKTEDKIDKLDVKIDKLCQRIFALNQPIASDLRFIMSSLQIGNDLERIGDIALSIVNKSEAVREQPEILEKFNIEQIITSSYNIIQKSFQNYTAYNSENIYEIIAECRNIKDESNKILDNIILEMSQKNEVIVVATNLILILRQIERIAGHSANIAESIYFINEGTIIKHNKRKEKPTHGIFDENKQNITDDNSVNEA
ncbi:MAG: phosphate transport system regulatory protein PhoU [Bacteroidetes bacterium GWA2_30_7]|nr:MAG: phosphate transport system regulatory protein PhoU [Bacteroidetes bacterium GWA2_30_7]